MRSPKPTVRRAALRSLAAQEEAPTADEIDAAADSLHSSDPTVKHAALDLLGFLAEHRKISLSSEIVQQALALTDDESSAVRREACACLALIPLTGFPDGNQRAQSLALRLRDDHPSVRQEAAAALGDLPSLGVTLPSVVRDQLAATLLDENDGARFEAAFALASLRDVRARAHLERWLNVRPFRIDAMEALGRLGDPDARAALRSVTGRWFLPWVDRLTGLSALIRLGDVPARHELAERGRARRVEERIYALALIGQLNVKEGLEVVRETASRQDDPAREAAMEALGELGTQDDLERLERWSRDPQLSGDTREAAAEAAVKLGARDWLSSDES